MADCTGLYTCDELIAKLKDLNEKLDDAETKSKLDTGQSQHEYTQSVAQLQRQYEKYLAMLKRACPDCYRTIVGPSAIRFTGRGRGCL